VHAEVCMAFNTSHNSLRSKAPVAHCGTGLEAHLNQLLLIIRFPSGVLCTSQVSYWHFCLKVYFWESAMVVLHNPRRPSSHCSLCEVWPQELCCT
jgi:hypothetical protein